MNKNQIIKEIKKPENFNSIFLTKVELKFNNILTLHLEIPKSISFKDIFLYFTNQQYFALINWDDVTEFDFFELSNYQIKLHIENNFCSQYKSNQDLIKATLDELGFTMSMINNKIFNNNVV